MVYTVAVAAWPRPSSKPLVEAGLYNNELVVDGGCQAKIGMKYAAHLKHNIPLLEDVLARMSQLSDGMSLVLEANARRDA